jgi:hypothetical protein
MGDPQNPKRVVYRVTDNRARILEKLDALRAELDRLRVLLEDENADIQNYLAEASKARSTWLGARMRGDWSAEELKTAGISSTGFLGNLLGMRPRDKKRSD